MSREAMVRKEYDKDNIIKPEDIEKITKWVDEQPHLPRNIPEFDLIMAYHSCEYKIELTRHVIDLNYTLRTVFDFYQKREIDSTLEAAFETWLMTPLNTSTNNGYRPIYCQLLNADPNKFVYNDVVRAFVMVMDLWQFEEGSVPGVAVIVNMDKVSINHISQIDLIVAQQFFYFLQEAMFVKLKEFHFINAPTFMDRLLAMVRPFMKEDMLALLKVHSAGSNTFNDYISMSALPSDAGGENEDSIVLKERMWNKIKANKSFFQEDMQRRVDETKRPGGPKTMSTFFSGLEESFKKLDID